MGLKDTLKVISYSIRYLIWKQKGEAVPVPGKVKKLLVLHYLKKYRLKRFLETGTLHGQMTDFIRPHVEQLYTIELDEHLHEEVLHRFANFDHIHTLYGDSGHLMAKVLTQLNGPALIWLDAHYSGGITAMGDKETPIMEELAAIVHNLDHRHVILIDDARLFDGTHDYPTIEEIKKLCEGVYILKQKRDMLILIPAKN